MSIAAEKARYEAACFCCRCVGIQHTQRHVNGKSFPSLHQTPPEAIPRAEFQHPSSFNINSNPFTSTLLGFVGKRCSQTPRGIAEQSCGLI